MLWRRISVVAGCLVLLALLHIPNGTAKCRPRSKFVEDPLVAFASGFQLSLNYGIDSSPFSPFFVSKEKSF